MAVPSLPTFTLLHTNDFHNHLTEAQAHRLRLLHDSLQGNGLLLDAGDAISAGNITYRPGGEPILERMTEIGYDAMTVGNREFHFSRIGFESKLSRAGFPVLCANVRAAGKPAPDLISLENDPALPVRSHLFREFPGGWRVAVFGVTVPMITERMLARKVSAYVFDDPIVTAKRLVPLLRATYSPNLLIAMTHIGIHTDRLLAETVPGIDLILGGHTHVVLEAGERVGETLIAQAGSFGRFLGRVEAQRDSDDGSLRLTAALEAL